MKLRNIINSAIFSVLVASTLGLYAFAQSAPKPALKAKASVKTKAKRDVFGPFVPPPPPNIPTFSSIGEMGSFDMDLSGLSFLSEPDLKSRLASTEIRLKNAESKLKDQTATVEETKKRAQSFVELFDQGIVSKKELEGSSRDQTQAVADLEEAKGKVKDLELTVKAMKDRLAVLQKRKAISKSISKPGGSFENRKQNKSKRRPQSKQKNESRSLQAETTSDKSKN